MVASAAAAYFASRSLSNLHPHPLARQLRKPGAAGDAGLHALAVRRAVAVGGVKAEEAENAQVIFGDARGRLADEAHAPHLEIVKPADSSRAPRRLPSPTARSW